MAFYPKKLRNLRELEREKKRLQKSRRQMEEQFSSLKVFSGKSKEKDKEEEGGSLLDFLPGNNQLVNLVIQLVQKRLAKKETATSTAQEDEDKSTPPSKSWPKRIAIEFIGGYIKWKAIELSWKGIKYLINKKREEKE
jgi:hypothetical protein